MLLWMRLQRVIGIMAAILADRKLAPYDGGKRVPRLRAEH